MSEAVLKRHIRMHYDVYYTNKMHMDTWENLKLKLQYSFNGNQDAAKLFGVINLPIVIKGAWCISHDLNLLFVIEYCKVAKNSDTWKFAAIILKVEQGGFLLE